MKAKKFRIYLSYTLFTGLTYVVVTLFMDKILSHPIDFSRVLIKGLAFGLIMSLFLSSRYFRIRV